jgi:hypothetical protein
MEFRTPKGTILTDLCIDSSPDAAGKGKKIALRCAYQPATEKNIRLTCSPSVKILNQQDNKRGVINFTVEVLCVGTEEHISYVIAEFDGPVIGNIYHLDETLRLKIGKVKLHSNFESDLFAQMLGKSSDADQLLAYYRVLVAKNNMELPRVDWEQLNDNPLKQNTGSDARKWNCGGALLTFGQKFVPHHWLSGGVLYYGTPSPSKLSQVVFKKETVRAGAERIRNQLAHGNFVQVFVGHHEDLTVKGGVIMPSGNTHFVTFFGASRDGREFIFFDPWPGGSKLTYQSGLMGAVHSIFMGSMSFFETEGKIRSADSAEGAHRYVVLTGP